MISNLEAMRRLRDSSLFVWLLLVCFTCLSLGNVKQQYYRVHKNEWERQYSTGGWTFLGVHVFERSRSALVSVLIERFFGDRRGAVLDIGCGEGVLHDYIPAVVKDKYIGIDISAKAVEIARQKRNVSAFEMHLEHLTVEELTKLLPTHSALSHGIDVVVFNEVLYYTKHLNVLRKYHALMNTNGFVIISSWFSPNTSYVESGVASQGEHILSVAKTIFEFTEELVLYGRREDNQQVVASKISLLTKKQ